MNKSTRRQRLKKKWRETIQYSKPSSNKDQPRRYSNPKVSPTSPRNERGGVMSDPNGSSKPKIRAKSQQFFDLTKQRFASLVSHENVEIQPQNGFFFVKSTQEYISDCICYPERTIIDFRDKAEYRELHIRTAINIPYKYLNLPPEDEAANQYIECKDKKEQPDFEVKSLLSENDINSNKELFKNSWIDDILHYSIQRNVPHEFIIYAGGTRARKSTILPGIVHILKVLYKEAIESNQLSIYVLNRKFTFIFLF